jgi:hypothetical protein
VVRPRHSVKELEQVLRDAEARNWRVEGGGNSYFKIYCPCPMMHMKTVHLTPQRNYEKRLRRWLARRTCWETR